LLDPGDNGQYEVTSISMAIGNYTLANDPVSSEYPLFTVFTVDPGYLVDSEATRFDGTVYIEGSPMTYNDIAWDWTYLVLFDLGTSLSEYIPDITLPDLDSWPELSVFDQRKSFEIRFYSEGDDYFGVFGEITSLTAVPEPATIFLLGLGGLFLRKGRRF